VTGTPVPRLHGRVAPLRNAPLPNAPDVAGPEPFFRSGPAVFVGARTRRSPPPAPFRTAAARARWRAEPPVTRPAVTRPSSNGVAHRPPGRPLPGSTAGHRQRPG
jgi:hypothetical protein